MSASPRTYRVTINYKRRFRVVGGIREGVSISDETQAVSPLKALNNICFKNGLSDIYEQLKPLYLNDTGVVKIEEVGQLSLF